MTGLPDVPPAGSAKVLGGWWPPVMLHADRPSRHHDAFDVLHVHFGFDTKMPMQLLDVVDAPRRTGVPLVFTVRDRRNHCHEDRRLRNRTCSSRMPTPS